MRILLALVFVLSGAAGLIYQVVWTRYLVLVLGVTSEAVAITVASFMSGLAIGAAVAPRIVARVRRPVRWYAGLEVAIAVAALLLPVLLRGLAPLYAWTESSGLPVGRLLLTGALLVVPTSLMGATLPVLARLASDRVGSWVGLLYGANTLGATLGCLLAGFVLIELLGLSGAVACGVVANLAAAGLAMLADRELEPLPAEAPAPLRNGTLFRVVFFLTGFLAIALEILWTRLLLPRTGSEIYVFSGILAANLAGIGLGSLAYVRLGGAPSRAQFAKAQAVVGIASTILVVLASGALGSVSFELLVLLLLPATFAMGWAFPVGIALATPEGHSASVSAGGLYAWNTLGGILGSLSAVFVFAPLLGSANAAGLLSAAYLAVAAFLALGAGRAPVAALGALAVGLAIAAVTGAPGFRHPVFSVLGGAGAKVEIYEHAEDRVAAVTAGRLEGMTVGPFPRFLLVNGIGMTMRTVDTKMLAHLPGLLHPEAERALVLCMGMGTSLRSSLVHPHSQVDVVELVPTVPTFMHYFHDDAQQVLDDERGRIVIGDARHYLATSDESYDIISSDPPPPMHSAGTVLLYSREFYEDGRRRLREGGLFVQWFPLGQGTLADYLAHVRTFLSVFPEVTAWRSFDGLGFYLVGSESPVVPDVKRMAELLDGTAIRDDLVEWTPGLRALPPQKLAERLAGLRIASRAQLEAAVGDGPLITDDRPLSEYTLLRTRLGWDLSPPGTQAVVLGALVGGRAAPGRR